MPMRIKIIPKPTTNPSGEYGPICMRRPKETTISPVPTSTSPLQVNLFHFRLMAWLRSVARSTISSFGSAIIDVFSLFGPDNRMWYPRTPLQLYIRYSQVSRKKLLLRSSAFVWALSITHLFSSTIIPHHFRQANLVSRQSQHLRHIPFKILLLASVEDFAYDCILVIEATITQTCRTRYISERVSVPSSVSRSLSQKTSSFQVFNLIVKGK